MVVHMKCVSCILIMFQIAYRYHKFVFDDVGTLFFTCLSSI